MSELGKFRKEIDVLDAQIMALLGARFRLTGQIGEYKRDNNIPSRSPEREATQMERISQLAITYGVNPEYAVEVWRLTMDRVVTNHDALRAEDSVA